MAMSYASIYASPVFPKILSSKILIFPITPKLGNCRRQSAVFQIGNQFQPNQPTNQQAMEKDLGTIEVNANFLVSLY